MKKILSVVAITVMLASVSACMPPPPSTVVESTAESVLQDGAELGSDAAVTNELEALREENDELKMQLEEATAKLLEQPTEEEQAIIDDLADKTPVLPEGTSTTGPLRFYPERTKMLNDKYVFAYAEDGHEISVNMILRYYKNEDGTIEWESLLYDLGSGWEISE